MMSASHLGGGVQLLTTLNSWLGSRGHHCKAVVNSISSTCALPAMTSQNIGCEKDPFVREYASLKRDVS